MEKNGGIVLPRKYVSLPCIVEEHNYGVFNNDLQAACVALTERYLNLKIDGVLTKPIEPYKKIFNQRYISNFRNLLVRGMCNKAHVYSRSDVVEMYTGPKRAMYERAMIELEYDGLNLKDSWLKTFIKFEKTNVSKAPRIINPRSTKYTLELARYLKCLEKPLYYRINKAFGAKTKHTVVKGMDIIESAAVIKEKWDMYDDPIAIGGDITKLDMHISYDALCFEHSVYNMIFKNRKLQRLLRKQLINKGKAYFKDGSVAFKMRGKRSSGDINTSLGNCIIVCAVIYVFKRLSNIDFELINNGDDFVIITERSNLQIVNNLLPQVFMQHGLPLVMEKPVDVFEQLEFCQTKPVFDGLMYRMLRIPTTVLQKDIMCTVSIQTRKEYAKWLGGVGKCGLSLTRGIPVLSNFYQMLIRNGADCSDGFIGHIFKNTSMLYSIPKEYMFNDTISDDARISFYDAFGILPDYQRCLECYFDSVSVDFEFDMLSESIEESYLMGNNIILPV